MGIEDTRQVAFRLPHELIERIEHCERTIETIGLNLSRTDLVKLLLKYALDCSQCDITVLLGGAAAVPRRGNKARPENT